MRVCAILFYVTYTFFREKKRERLVHKIYIKNTYKHIIYKHVKYFLFSSFCLSIYLSSPVCLALCMYVRAFEFMRIVQKSIVYQMNINIRNGKPAVTTSK